MLSEQEIKAFLALVLTFCTDTQSSARTFAKLFNLMPNTAARWLRAARGKGGVLALYYVRTDPIRNAIMGANLHNAKHHSYRKLEEIKDLDKRIAALKQLLTQAQ
jgi:hypothetical protein